MNPTEPGSRCPISSRSRNGRIACHGSVSATAWIFTGYGDGVTGPTAALIRFHAGGYVPPHEHCGYEHILVLSGTQRDDLGTAAAGTLLVSAPGTRHQIVSEGGCIVLAIYEKPVSFQPE